MLMADKVPNLHSISPHISTSLWFLCGSTHQAVKSPADCGPDTVWSRLILPGDRHENIFIKSITHYTQLMKERKTGLDQLATAIIGVGEGGGI